MVKSETLFCRLTGIDTLLSFDGIIPSAADFQLRLISLIEQFNKALLTEDQTQAESESLCRALCCYFDKRLTSNKQHNSLSWQRYSLVHYFYGYTESQENLTLSAQLDALLNTDSEVIFRYAWKLLMLLIQLEGRTETLITLRTAWRARYFSRARAPLRSSAGEPASWIVQHGDAGSPRLMVFIIGPFAGKWFSQANLSSSSDNSIVWVVAEHVSTLIGRLEHVKKSHGTVTTLAFFPLLADGFENSSVMIEQITAWQHAFSSNRLPEHLPCLLGLYTRLSQQRYPHDPDSAIWTGGLTASPDCHLKLESRLVNLITELDARDDGSDLYAIQRHALACTLIAWLAEKRIMSVLQNLFDSTQIDLVGVLLADYGQGFTRHGAWSLWLAEKYGILPGLSTCIAMPPLPAIPLLPLIEQEQEPEAAPERPPAIALSPVRRKWPGIVALLAILICLTTVFYYYGKRNIDEIQSYLSRITPLKMLMREHEESADAALFTLSGTAPLFESGSSNLRPGSEEILAGLVPKIKGATQQKYLIIGHSDNTGSAAINLSLSTERARKIRDWLTEQTGLPASHFIIEGAGNSRPVASNDTQEGRAQNRRVEIIPLPVQHH
ncbi:OmpA family protein [Pantoea sp. FN0307]|uniref:OmpA family protein n=1 Tax=Pantoea sp. FN0307 TaxID=3418560 RepID=UPI003CE69921